MNELIGIVKPVWLAFGCGFIMGNVTMLSFLCLVYVFSRDNYCRSCPHLSDESEG